MMVKNRNRFDVKFFFPDGASIRWVSNKERSLTASEMVEELKSMIEVIEDYVDAPVSLDAVEAPRPDAVR